MKNKDEMKNKEYIQSLFDGDEIKAPESLSEDAVFKMLEIADSQAETDVAADKLAASAGAPECKRWKQARRARAKRWIALAACAILAIVGIPKIYYSDLFLPDTSAKNGELHEFKSRTEIERIIKSFNREPFLDRFRFGRGMGAGDMVEYATEDAPMASEATSDMASNSAKSAETGSASASGGGSDHSSTYLQVEDVDEADIVKVDGRYIYAVSNKQEVYIYEAKDGKTKKLSTIGSNGIEQYINDIFLKGDILVAVGHVYKGSDGYTAVVTYDISDRSNPKLINEFRQGGNDIVSSRMVGDYVYLVTTCYTYGNNIIPKCTIDGEYKEIAPTDICCVPNPKTSNYTILSAVDISSGQAGRSKTKALFGSTHNIYCNNHNLYVSVEEYDEKTWNVKTRVVRAALDGLKIKFNGTAIVEGYIDNQFSMDEYNGFFRIATTANRNGMDVNHLYVLDEKLQEVGKIASFARDESIKAVRFMGDTAYVITYEAIDPLFVMDLSDPTNPRIKGEVKIDGFSSLLVPIDGKRLLGIGHATGDNGYGGQYASGLKLALFDVSDPTEPKVLDSKEFKDMESPAQGTHLALTVNKDKGYYAIPYNIWDYGDVFVDDDVDITDDAESIPAPDELGGDFTYEEPIREPQNETGVLVFGVGGSDKDKIEVYDQHKLDAVQILRNAYIGDYIYGITGKAEIHSFKFEK